MKTNILTTRVSCALFVIIAVSPLFVKTSSSAKKSADKIQAVQPDHLSELEAAIQSYKEGKFSKAISQLETLYKEYPNQRQIKDALIEALVVASEESYLLGNVDESHRFLARALEISPDIKAVNRLYEKSRREDAAPPSKPPPVKEKPKTKLEEESQPIEPLPADVETFYTMVQKMVQAQKEVLNQTQNSLGKIVKESTEEKEKVLESLDKREKILLDEIKFGRKSSLWFIAASVSFVVLLIFLSLWIIQRIAARREKILMDQGEKFAQLVQDQSVKTLDHLHQTLSALPKMLPSSHGISREETIAKLKQIDVIDAEIVQDKTSASIDNETVRTLLNDPDPEVKVRTIQLLLKVDQEEAYRQINQLSSAPEPEVRILTAKLMSGIATSESVKMLTQMLRDRDHSVKRQAFISLKGFLNENIALQMKEEIEKSLSEVSKRENWVT